MNALLLSLAGFELATKDFRLRPFFQEQYQVGQAGL